MAHAQGEGCLQPFGREASPQPTACLLLSYDCPPSLSPYLQLEGLTGIERRQESELSQEGSLLLMVLQALEKAGGGENKSACYTVGRLNFSW